MKTRFSPFLRMSPLVLILALGIACTKAPNDAQVTSDIQKELCADSGLQNKQIAVQSDKGTVTLSGTVENDAQRDAAAKYAASEPGVNTVVNNLQVAPMAAAEAPQQDASQASEPAPAEQPAPSRKPPATRHHRSTSQDYSRDSQPAPNSADNSAPAQAPLPPQQQAAAPPPPPAPQKVTIPSGTALPVRLVDPIDSATAQTGDTFHATLDSPLAVDGEVVVPAHYDVEGHVVAAQAS